MLSLDNPWPVVLVVHDHLDASIKAGVKDFNWLGFPSYRKFGWFKNDQQHDSRSHKSITQYIYLITNWTLKMLF